jgi:segregation and condensation protein A
MDSMCIATIGGVRLTEVPHDLFIPPDALEVLLDSFTGPLDLLLYLIRRQNIDIMDIPILKITRQYMVYIELMEQRRLELAAEYLLMAAMLAEIKSKLLLPVPPLGPDETEEDPRMALVRRLQIYEQYKQAAMAVDVLPRCARDVFLVKVNVDEWVIPRPEPFVELSSIVLAMQSLLIERGHEKTYPIQHEALSVRSRIAYVLQCISNDELIAFKCLYTEKEGRKGLVVSLLAILELAKQSLLHIIQSAVYAPIYIKANHDG